jgi:HAD superfamily hydrolase (TIGR01457 family)
MARRPAAAPIALLMLASSYDAILFDLDGVVYRGEELVPRAAETLVRLRQDGPRVAFLTNNSSRTPEMIAEHLVALGITTSADEIVTSAGATAAVLARRGIAAAYVVGEEGLRRALADAGIHVADEGPVDAVVVGLDRTVTYERLRDAAILVDAGAALVGTNPDGSYPTSEGARWPGAGALLAAVVATTGADAEIVGKPHPALFEAALERTRGSKPLVVGDRLDTDIAGADALGWDSALVLTGISTIDELEGSPWQPTFVLEDIGGLVE